jgi:hypothetical protein
MCFPYPGSRRGDQKRAVATAKHHRYLPERTLYSSSLLQDSDGMQQSIGWNFLYGAWAGSMK